jgi:secreted trypsin-like serine protease
VFKPLGIEATRAKVLVVTLLVWASALTCVAFIQHQSRVSEEQEAGRSAHAKAQKLRSDIEVASAKLAKLKRPPALPLDAPRNKAQAQALLEQSQEITDFIQSNPPTQQLATAVSLLNTTNRQAALAASQSDLGLVWSGAAVATVGQFPYQVGIVLSNLVPYAQQGYKCGGALIAPTWVLTAGHCLDENSQAIDVQVFSGVLNLSDTPADDCNCWTTVTHLYRHPDYKILVTKYGQMYDADVALLELKESPIRPGVASIQIASPAVQAKLLSAHLGTISGWGRSSASASILSNGLMYGTVKINSACATAYGPGIVMPDMVCTTPEPAAACSGDSGGALVMHEPFPGSTSRNVVHAATPPSYVEAVVSWSYPYGACPPTKPTVYARVPALTQWIDDCISGKPCPSTIKGTN